jgi:hypothetical protein
MTIRIDATIRACLWRLDGRCVRRMKHRCAGANGNCPSPGRRKPPTVPDLLDFIRRKGSIDALPKCDEVPGSPGSPCPHLPIFDGLVLSFRGEVLLKFSRRCRQSEVLQAFQSRGWPDVLEIPHSRYDSEDRRSNIVYELNERHRQQHPRRRIHFWSGDSGVHWKVVGEPAPFPAPVRSAPMVGHD